LNNSKDLKEAWAIRKTSRKLFTAHQSGILFYAITHGENIHTINGSNNKKLISKSLRKYACA